MVQTIHFFSEDIEFELSEPEAIRLWIGKIAALYDRNIAEISYIFCSDDYLHKINVEHLQHDTYTDIITFPLHEEGQDLMSDIFISVDRIRENAKSLDLPFHKELHRVMIHGILHLCGLEDKGEEAAANMRAAEDKALATLVI